MHAHVANGVFRRQWSGCQGQSQTRLAPAPIGAIFQCQAAAVGLGDLPA